MACSVNHARKRFVVWWRKVCDIQTALVVTIGFNRRRRKVDGQRGVFRD